MRTRTTSLAFASVACLAVVLYLIVEGGSWKVHADADPAPSRTSNARPTQGVERTGAVDVKRQPELQVARNVAGPPLDSATIVHCHWAFVGSRPIERQCADPKSALGMRQCQELQVTDALRIQTMSGEAAAC